jgi:hypothetical protein
MTNRTTAEISAELCGVIEDKIRLLLEQASGG